MTLEELKKKYEVIEGQPNLDDCPPEYRRRPLNWNPAETFEPAKNLAAEWKRAGFRAWTATLGVFGWGASIGILLPANEDPLEEHGLLTVDDLEARTLLYHFNEHWKIHPESRTLFDKLFKAIVNSPDKWQQVFFRHAVPSKNFRDLIKTSDCKINLFTADQIANPESNSRLIKAAGPSLREAVLAGLGKVGTAEPCLCFAFLADERFLGIFGATMPQPKTLQLVPICL